jgi:hypothetical protein
VGALNAAGSLLLFIALLALAIYLIVSGTDLQLWGASWLLALIMAGQAVARRGRNPRHVRWLMPGLLLAATWNVFYAFAHERQWPPAELHPITLIGYGVGVVSAVLLVVALVLEIRPGGFRWRRPPAAQP